MEVLDARGPQRVYLLNDSGHDVGSIGIDHCQVLQISEHPLKRTTIISRDQREHSQPTSPSCMTGAKLTIWERASSCRTGHRRPIREVST